MLRVVILASEGHLRIVSTVLRALEYTDRVTVVVLEDVEPEKVDLLDAHPVRWSAGQHRHLNWRASSRGRGSRAIPGD